MPTKTDIIFMSIWIIPGLLLFWYKNPFIAYFAICSKMAHLGYLAIGEDLIKLFKAKNKLKKKEEQKLLSLPEPIRVNIQATAQKINETKK